MRRRLVILLASVMLMPQIARAQIDSILDLIFDAVEPTPVYDTELTQATEKLADKIERLNNVLFGGAEQTSSAYRYKTMYSDLHDLTASLSDYIQRSYSNAQRLEKMYSSMEGDNIGSYGYKIKETWSMYENSVANGKRLIEKFRKVFGDHNVTNAEVRQQAKETILEIKKEQALEQRRIDEEVESTQLAEGLVQCMDFMRADAGAYVSAGKKTYGTSINSGGSSTVMGSLGTAVMIFIGLLCIVFGVFAGIHVMKGSAAAETEIARVVIFFVLSLLIILAIQSNI